MRLTSARAEAAGTVIIVNPERVDGAFPHPDGTMLQIGPEEVPVQEPFDKVAEELEAHWAARQTSAALDQLLEPLVPLAGVLPLVVPMILQEATAWAAKKAAPRPVDPARVHPDAPVDPYAGRPDPCAPAGTASPVETTESGELVTCRNCGKGASAARLCPHCGSVLVGEG